MKDYLNKLSQQSSEGDTVEDLIEAVAKTARCGVHRVKWWSWSQTFGNHTRE